MKSQQSLRGSPSVFFSFLLSIVFLLGVNFGGLNNTEYVLRALNPSSIDIPSSNAVSSSNNVINNDTAKLGDGCHHIFLDVGANIGVHARFLHEPEKYPNATMAKGWFDDAFGADRDSRDLCVFSFEPNPAHQERLDSLAAAYNAMGWRYVPIYAGVSDAAGTLDFTGDGGLGRGFSARKNVKGKPSVSVPVLRLASWLLEEIDGRKPPKTVYGDFKKNEPTVVMKLDIETLEYIVLPDLLSSGALCNVLDVVFGEIHYQFFPLDFKNNDFVLEKAKEAKGYFLDMLKVLKINPSCNAKWVIQDDESHSMDGVPFPVPPSQNITRN